MTRYLIVCQTPERAWKLCKRLARHLFDTGFHVRFSECNGTPFIDILGCDIMIDFIGDISRLQGRRYDNMFSELMTEKWLDEKEKEKKDGN